MDNKSRLTTPSVIIVTIIYIWLNTIFLLVLMSVSTIATLIEGDSIVLTSSKFLDMVLGIFGIVSLIVFYSKKALGRILNVAYLFLLELKIVLFTLTQAVSEFGSMTINTLLATKTGFLHILLLSILMFLVFDKKVRAYYSTISESGHK